MAISRDVLETEITGSEAALKAHEQGIEIHKIVLGAFKAELAKMPKPKKEEKLSIVEKS